MGPGFESLEVHQKKILCFFIFPSYELNSKYDSNWLLICRAGLKADIVDLSYKIQTHISAQAIYRERYARVQGSSPWRCTRKKSIAIAMLFFQRNKSLVGFVKCTSCVKYGFAMWNALRRVKGFILFHIATKEQYFTIFARKLFHIHRRWIFH